MQRNLGKFVLGVGLAGAAIAVATNDAEAKAAKRRHRFKSAPARAHPKTPALGANGEMDSSSRSPVAGGAVEGGFRQDVVSGGALLAMARLEDGSHRALVLNSYRGLSLVDTSDAAAPEVLGRPVEFEGTAQRMFLGTDEVAVISDVYGPEGSKTVVTSVAIGSASLTRKGSCETSGSLRDAARSGDDLVLVVGNSYYGPMMMTADGSMPPAPGGNSPAGGLKSASGIPFWGGYGGGSHVARVQIGADGAPSIHVSAEINGDVLVGALNGTEAVLAVQSQYYYPGSSGDPTRGQDPSGGANGVFDGGGFEGYWTPPTISLVRYADDANGVPTAGGALELSGVSGVAALDRDGSTLRALEYSDSGEIVATYDLSGGAPTAFDSISIGAWPSAWAFVGGAFVYGTTNWNYYETLPPIEDPVFNPDGVKQTFDGMNSASGKPGAGAFAPGPQGPTSSLNSIDLRDPSHLVAGSPIDLGAGWLSQLLVVEGGVVGQRSGYDGQSGTTSVFRIDATDPAVLKLAKTASITGYANIGPVIGDILLVNGGSTNDTGAFLPTTQLVGLNDGGLTLGGSYSVSAWTAAAARDANLLGLASYDRLTLVDVSDVMNPTFEGEVRFVVNVAGFAALSADWGAVLATDYVGGGVEVRSVALPDADPLKARSTLKVGTGDAQMFAAPPYLYVVATDWSSGRASLTVVDASDPENLRQGGSLPLASYPGQVFLKDGALLLLRRAQTLFVDVQTKRGKTTKKAAPDAFGKASKSWLKYVQGAVLDVVDLSNPDEPKPARRRFLGWDDSGVAQLSGGSLYVPTYFDMTRFGADMYAYMVAEIDVTNPLRPRVRAPIDVPGQLVAAAGEPHKVLTTSYGYDENTGVSTTTLHVVDLSLPWNRRVLASHDFAGWPESVTVGAGHVYVTSTQWIMQTMDAAFAPTPKSSPSELVTLDLSDLSQTSRTDRAGGAYAGQVESGCLFLRTWGWTGAIDVYSLGDPASPEFSASQSVGGNGGQIVVVGGRAYVPGGMYGVQSFDLSK